ncbi:hypothetical protein LINGRAHAP2_LOCUS4014, partial [Linum grandiflorum]
WGCENKVDISLIINPISGSVESPGFHTRSQSISNPTNIRNTLLVVPLGTQVSMPQKLQSNFNQLSMNVEINYSGNSSFDVLVCLTNLKYFWRCRNESFVAKVMHLKLRHVLAALCNKGNDVYLDINPNLEKLPNKKRNLEDGEDNSTIKSKLTDKDMVEAANPKWLPKTR